MCLILVFIFIVTSNTSCSGQNQLTAIKTSEASKTPTSTSVKPTVTIQTTQTSSHPTVTIIFTTESNQEYNYLLVENKNQNYLRVTCTLREYDSSGYFKNDYPYDTIFYIPPHSFWTLSTPLSKSVLQYCKVMDIKAQGIPLSPGSPLYCDVQPQGNFSIQNSASGAFMVGVLLNQGKITPSVIQIQMFFYDETGNILAVRSNQITQGLPPPGEKTQVNQRQISFSGGPTMKYASTRAYVIAYQH